jgi:hypothetical protein
MSQQQRFAYISHFIPDWISQIQKYLGRKENQCLLYNLFGSPAQLTAKNKCHSTAQELRGSQIRKWLFLYNSRTPCKAVFNILDPLFSWDMLIQIL